jgi:hypothetical protein
MNTNERLTHLRGIIKQARDGFVDGEPYVLTYTNIIDELDEIIALAVESSREAAGPCSACGDGDTAMEYHTHTTKPQGEQGAVGLCMTCGRPKPVIVATNVPTCPECWQMFDSPRAGREGGRAARNSRKQ